MSEADIRYWKNLCKQKKQEFISEFVEFFNKKVYDVYVRHNGEDLVRVLLSDWNKELKKWEGKLK